MYARLRCSGNMPLCLAFGTGEGYLWYGICVPCSKRLPVVRDASSEALGAQKGFYGTEEIFGAKNSLLLYATHLQRCAKQPPAPPNAFSKAQKRHPATLNAS